MKQLLIMAAIAMLSLCFSTHSNAQEYQSAIGARLGSPVSLSYKTFLGGSSNAIELFVNYRGRLGLFNNYGWNRYGAGGAYLVHFPIEDVLDGLFWYAGGGASVYFWGYDDSIIFNDADNLSFGIQGYIGFDYKVEDMPLNISIDWSPNILINGYVNGFGVRYGAVSVRYTLND
jgi:hypothetical protein